MELILRLGEFLSAVESLFMVGRIHLLIVWIGWKKGECVYSVVRTIISGGEIIQFIPCKIKIMSWRIFKCPVRKWKCKFMCDFLFCWSYMRKLKITRVHKYISVDVEISMILKNDKIECFCERILENHIKIQFFFVVLQKEI